MSLPSLLWTTFGTDDIEPVTSSMNRIGTLLGCASLSRASRTPPLSLLGSSASCSAVATLPARTAASWVNTGVFVAARALARSS